MSSSEKRPICIIGTEGKSKEQIKDEAKAAYVKFLQESQSDRQTP